ncbi:carbohydrate-binding protein [Actinoplanes flavus]|uniref:Carbohydrate-binding protein n=1 Tax=Actinoplanes flavus TaxID=2820290 RepID=A0ABS3UW14_9ACTN|nr:carbohydrate-binding protein [Actinoplanes flavus]MBO3742774.1 carbohydrate-binding protein [Actinoplanes flavus]
MENRSPNVYRTRSWQNRRRALLALGGVGLVLVGYLLGRWQDTPADPVITGQTVVTPDATTTPPAAPSATPASAEPNPVKYPVLQAEAATELAGVDTQPTDDEGGGDNVGWINRDDHLRFDNFAFGAVPATAARIRVSSGAGITGRVQIRLDSRTNDPVGELSVGNTGGWQKWRTDTAVLKPVTGTHTVFVTFTSAEGAEFVNVNWLQFEH